MIIVHFEVYVLEGRGWMLHARFPRLERDEAVREAKEIENTLGIRTKVVRETYNTDSNQMDEAEVYISGTNIQPKKGGLAKAGGGIGGGGGVGGGARGGGGGRGGGAVGYRPGSYSQATAGTAKVVFRLLVVLMIASAMALGALRLVPDIVEFLYAYGFRVTPDEYGQLLFGVFICVLLMTGVPLGLRMIPRHAGVSMRRAAPMPTTAAQRRAQTDARMKKSLDKLAAEAAWEAIPDKWADDDPEASADDSLPQINEHPEDDEPPPLVPQSDEGGLDAKAVDALPETEALSAAQGAIDRFVDKTVAVVRQQPTAMDKYTVFGLNLFMAGAVQAVALAKGMDSDGSRKLLKTILQKLGNGPDQAAAFYDKVPDYGREAKYGKMVLAGKSAMESWGAGDEMTPMITLQTALKDWNKPTTEKKASIMTVMFTDMVGSTDLTQARGDVAAQEIVRKHNTIVRTALTQFAGHEVKHTGDGIMASFNSAANAVDATIQIQRQTAAHNEKNPDLPLHLRIGLNAGEPIQEEDDLFGSTVQLAARVCAATQSDQTLCTQVVRDLAGAKPIPWGNAGMHALKGFRDKFQLWEIPF